MILSHTDMTLIRDLTKDEAAFNHLLTLLEQRHVTYQDVVQQSTAPVDMFFLEHAPSAIVITDAQQDNHPIIYANAKFEQDTGYKRDEFIGKNLRFLQGNDRDQRERQIIQEALAKNEPCQVTIRNYRKDGSLFFNELYITPVFNTSGVVTHFIGVQHDVTERERVRITLNQTLDEQRLYKEMIQSSSDAISLVNRSYIYEVVNKTYLQRTGLRREDIEGQHVADVMGESVFKNVLQPQLDRCFAGETIRFSEWFDFAKIGRRFVYAIYHPHRDSVGNIIGAVVNTRDITDVKEAEERAHELAFEQQRVQTLREFIQDASHDLRTPLTAMHTSLYLLRRTSECQHPRLDTIESHLNTLQSMLENLFELSEVGLSQNFEHSTVDVNQLLSQLVDELEPVIKSKQQVLNLELIPANLPVKADRDYLPRVFWNLIANATNYTPQHGSISVRSHSVNGHVIVEVEDTGIGISEEDLPHIFDRFYRAENARNIQNGQSGLGLSIVKKIIDNHQGHIEVESRLGYGSVFRTYLPREH